MVFTKLVAIPGRKLKQVRGGPGSIPSVSFPGSPPPRSLRAACAGFVTFSRRQPCSGCTRPRAPWMAYEFVTLPTMLSQLSQPNGPDPGFFGDYMPAKASQQAILKLTVDHGGPSSSNSSGRAGSRQL
jgi:hypothetical protein